MRDRIDVPLEIKAFDDQTGEIEGYGSVFGKEDLGGDIIERGAFADTLAERQKAGKVIPMLWQHEMKDTIGFWDVYAEDTHGLKLKGRILPDVTRGKEAIILAKAGAVEGLSIGYILDRDGYVDDHKTGIRTISRVKSLLEVSLVTIPMNPLAGLTGVKFMEAVETMTVRDIEQWIRDESSRSNREIKAAVSRLLDLGAEREAPAIADKARGEKAAEALLATLRR